MKVLQLTISIWMIILTMHIAHSQNSFTALKQNMETRVKQIAQAMTNIYNQKGCSDDVLKCKRKSYNQCQGTSQRKCFDDLPTPDGCKNNGTYLSKQSTISYPPNVDANRLSPQDKWLTCASAYLQESFVKEGDTTYAYQYIGTNTGSFRVYPSLRMVQNDTDNCFEFDTRTRPWYVTAASGSKNVIIFIDTSNSMTNFPNKFNTAKEATKAVIDTLSNNDFVGIVTFDDTARRIRKNLVRSTTKAKEELKEEIEKLTARGKTNYKEAFEEGFQLLQNSIEDQYGRQCSDSENIFLFLTDGRPTVPENYKDFGSLKQLIHDLKANKAGNQSHKIKLFTYGFGDQSQLDIDLLRGLSCEFNGITILISNQQGRSGLVSAMKEYYKVISEGAQIREPIWTQPYFDLYGFGKLVGVSMPIYYTSPGGIKTLLGVASVDQSFQTFAKLISSGSQSQKQIEIMGRLLKNLPCPQGSLDNCELQMIRPSYSKCPELFCSDERIQSDYACLPDGLLSYKDIFQEPEEKTKQRCCLSSDESDGDIYLVVIIIPSIVIGVPTLIVIISLICYYCKKKSKPEQEEQQRNKTKNDAEGGVSAGYFNNHNALQLNNPYENKDNPPPYIP